MNKTISKQIIRKFNPKSDLLNITKDDNEELPVKQWIEKYRDVLPVEDIIWLLCRNEFLSNKDLMLFAIWCAREALKLIEIPDERSVEACNVAERYVNGEATKEELLAARDAANEAAHYAAHYANEAAHYTAHYADDIAVYDKADIVYIATYAYSVAYAYSAAYYASYAAYSDSYFTSTTAYAVSNDASYAASYAADAAYAVNDVVYATSAVDYAATRSAQLDQLLTYFE
jgi:hypothetical protein